MISEQRRWWPVARDVTWRAEILVRPQLRPVARQFTAAASSHDYDAADYRDSGDEDSDRHTRIVPRPGNWFYRQALAGR